jgi:hypothetical protein
MSMQVSSCCISQGATCVHCAIIIRRRKANQPAEAAFMQLPASFPGTGPVGCLVCERQARLASLLCNYLSLTSLSCTEPAPKSCNNDWQSIDQIALRKKTNCITETDQHPEQEIILGHYLVLKRWHQAPSGLRGYILIDQSAVLSGDI